MRLSTRGVLIVSVVLLCLGGVQVARAGELPDYMEHWEFGLNIDENEGPSYFADTIFPLHRSEDGQSVVFLEPRLTYLNSESLANIGVGYRQLSEDQAWLVGGNLFYDYDSTHSHYRLGGGLEALSAFAEIRANSYFGLSPRRRVKEVDGINTFEEAVTGFDLEVGAPVPYYSRLKVFGGYEWYDFEKFKNRYGWRLRVEFKPLPYVVLDGVMSNSTKNNLDWGMTLAFKIPFGANAADDADVQSLLDLDTEMFPDSDASDRFWVLVERHHEMVIEAYAETPAGLVVEAGRT